MTDANDVESESTEVRVSLDECPAPSVAVIEAVAEATDTDPMNLPQLHDIVDTEALDLLFAERGGGGQRAGGTVTFEYANCEVVVNGDVAVVATTN